MRRLCLLILITGIVTLLVSAQPKYRTFTPAQLAQKAEPLAGKNIASRVSYVIKNLYTTPKNVLSAHLSSPILSLEDSGGFPSVRLANYRTTIIAEGKELQPGDSVVIHAKVSRKLPGTMITGWQMRMAPVATASPSSINMPGATVVSLSIDYTATIMKALSPFSDEQIVAHPTGGNVRDYLYQREVKKATGIVLGIANAPGKAGWIRSIRSDGASFANTGTPRCYDSISMSAYRKKLFVGELKSPLVRQYNNRLLNSLLALRLSILANDSGITEPFDRDVTPFGSLIYFDSTNLSDRFNNYTVKQIGDFTDSALTFCGFVSPETYNTLELTINKILNAFTGTVEILKMRPMLVPGVNSLAGAPFLHENPAAVPGIPSRKADTAVETTPLQNGLLANYPNPFNPTTNLSFTLSNHSFVTLKVFNLLGQEVAVLLNYSEMDEGEHSVEFDASSFSSGTYYYRLLATDPKTGNAFTDVKKMTLMK